jgi:hypothetical protein
LIHPQSYFFDLSTLVKQAKQLSLEISAISRTLYIFDTQIAKVSIPVNINKLDDKRQWYYLKNTKEENVISILTSIYCELKSEKSLQSLQLDNSLQNSSCVIQNKNDLSYDQYRHSSNSNHNFRNVMNKTTANANLTYTNNLNFLNNYSVDEIGLENKKQRKNNLDSTVIYNENYKSPEVSLINNNLFSPYSYRIDAEKVRGTGFSYTGQMLANLNSRLNLNNTLTMTINNTINGDLITHSNHGNVHGGNVSSSPFTAMLSNNDSFFDFNLIDENFLMEHPDVINKIKNKISQIKEEQEKLRKLNEDVFRNKESKILKN